MHRATLLLDDNTTKVCAWGNKSQSARVDDGRWHHLAVTYDFGAKKACSYVTDLPEKDGIEKAMKHFRLI